MPPTRREGSWPWLVEGAIAPTVATPGGVPRGEGEVGHAASVSAWNSSSVREWIWFSHPFAPDTCRLRRVSALALCNIIVFVRLSPQAL
jgi:hypothetical protein